MKKFLALALAVIMVLGLVACGIETPATDPTTQPTTEPTTAPTEGNDPTEDTEPTEPPVDIELSTEAGKYTYSLSITSFPTTWNPHTYQTSTDSSIMSYMTDGFYGFDFNETMDGYVLVPSMTTDDHPIDITADYVGQYGVAEGDTAKVYKINLREDLTWSDGTPITAHDFVESAKRLLNPAAQNYRADSLYSGNVKIYGAENYLKQGTYAYSNMISANYGDDEYVAMDAFGANEAGNYYVDGVGDVWFNVDDGGNWGSALSLYYSYGYLEGSENATNLWENVIVPAASEDGYVAVNETIANALSDCIAVLHGYENAAAYAEAAGDYAYMEWQEFCYYGADKAEYAWEDVGIFALSDYELVYAMINPLSGFYLKYSLPGEYLVKLDLYDSCESVVDGVYTNTYGTSVETSASYGTYIMTDYQIDKQIKFTRNDLYFDLTEDTYQTTDIVYSYVPEATTRLELFLSGKLDTYGLQADDMDTYALSDYTYYSTGDSTFAMCFNPDLAALETTQANAGENINKTIITLTNFRMAMSLALDRANFCLATSPLNSAAFGLYSSLIISDPDTGVAYRSTDVAKETLAQFWGVSEEYGEGKLYADIDEAIDSITGYNLEMAKQYFDAAYDEAIANGMMDEDDVVQICIGTPNSTSSFYNNGYEFLVNNYTEAVKGTKLEGKLTFTKDDTLGNSFSDALKNNTVDMLFGVGWTGSALDPYGLIEAYVDSAYQYDDSFDYTQIELTIELNGIEMTTSVYDWYMIMNGTACTVTTPDGTMEYSCGTADNDPEARLIILGKLEGAVLLNYNFIPIMDDASAQLVGQKVHYFNDEYIYGVGFGGIKYMTYNYDDAQWADYLASQNNELDYT